MAGFPVGGLVGSARDMNRRRSEPPTLGCMLLDPFTPLNPNPKPNQMSSRCWIAGQSSGWWPRQFRTAAVLPARCGVGWESYGVCMTCRPHQGGLVDRLQV